MFGVNTFGGIAAGFAALGVFTPPSPLPPDPFPPTPQVLFRVNGTVVPRVRFPGLTIHDVLGAQPNTAQLTFDRIEPNVGAHIEIGLGDFAASHLLFAGEIQRLDETYQSRPTPLLTEWPADLVDYSFALNKRRPIQSYVNQSASFVATNLMTIYAPTFTSVHVQAGLPLVTINFDGTQPLLECLADLANAINPPARCKIDYSGDLHFFVPPEAGITPPDPLTWDNRPLNNPPIRFTVDLSQVRTRCYGKGHGESVPVDIAAGETMLPLPDMSFYTATGGKVIAGITDDGGQTQVMSYSGYSADAGHLTTARGVAKSPGTPTPSQAAGLSGNLAAGSYTYLVTVVNDKGDESENGGVNTGSISALFVPTSPSPTPILSNGGLSQGNYSYRIAFRTSNGTTVTGAAGSASISGVPVAASSPSLSATTGGSMVGGTNYFYAIANVTPKGEMYLAGGSSVTLSAGQNAVSVSNIWTSTDARVTGRRLYRSKSRPTGAPPTSIAEWFLVATLNDNTTTTFLDTQPDSGLPGINPQPPIIQTQMNATSGQMTVPVPTSSDSRVTSRAIYRTIADGSEFRLLRVISDNTTTTITDSTADEGLGGEQMPSVSTADNGRMNVVMPTGPAGTVSRRLYRYDGVSSYRFVLSIGDNTTATVTDNVATASLGVSLDPASHWRTTAGSTSLLVTDTSQFSEGKGWIGVGQQVIRFTGRSTTSGVGSLTGIPASGVGAIVSDIQFGAAVVGYPWLKLTGGGVPTAMQKGSAVNIWIQRDDTAAQTALGLLERKRDGTPSDGIREYLIVDERRNESSLTQLCDADLATFADPTIAVTYCCRDPKSKAGQVVSIDLQSSPAVFSPAVFNPAVFNTGTAWGFTGEYLIQSVTISIDASTQLLPRYQVQASSVKFTFTDLLQRVLIGA